MYLNYWPLVDYEKYVNFIVSKVHEFFDKSEGNQLYPSNEWCAEQLLITFEKFQSNITPAKIIDEIVSKWRNMNNAFVPPKKNDLLFCKINSIDYYPNSKTPILNLSIVNSSQKIGLWLNPSQAKIFKCFNSSNSQFEYDNPIAKLMNPGRNIRLITSMVLNDYYMLPIKCILLELNGGSAFDLNWFKDNVKFNIINSLMLKTYKTDFIFVKVIEKKENSFFVKDDSIKSLIELPLDRTEVDYYKLIDRGDMILIWKPKYTRNPFSIHLSKESIIIRGPSLDYENNQQKMGKIMICGIVDSIVHHCNNIEWMGCSITILTSYNNSSQTEISKSDNEKYKRKTIKFSNKTPYTQKKILSSIQNGHFIYLFNLFIEDTSTYKFSHGSSIYNLNAISSFLDSMVFCPVSIKNILGYTSGIIRASIVQLNIFEAIIHIDCNCAVDKNTVCARCLTQITGRTEKVMLIHALVDDGSDLLDLYGYSTTFDLLGIDIKDWTTLPLEVKEKLLYNELGRELVFFISQTNPIDFNIGKGADVWRVDLFSEGCEETNRVCKFLTDNLNDENSRYIVGSYGDSLFHNPNLPI